MNLAKIADASYPKANVTLTTNGFYTGYLLGVRHFTS